VEIAFYTPGTGRSNHQTEKRQKAYMDFKSLGLGQETLQAVEDAGYQHPTPIQEKAIPIVLQGRDVLGCAQTGTGKTASFTLPMIDILSTGRARARMPRSLILTPTRELAMQISENFDVYGKYHKLSMALLIGGVSMGDQQRKLERGVDVLIATPGRLIDLFERGSVLLTGIKVLVIDEADRMLDMGFIPDVERIVSLLQPIRQTLMFSATMPKEIRRLADQFLVSPKEIRVAPPASPADTVDQSLVMTTAREKGKALRSLIESQPVDNALIFCNRKKDVDELSRSLKRHGLSAAGLHGDMAQSSRMETLAAFKEGAISLLVATDVAGRGLDIIGLSHVFNYDVPNHPEDYVHRIGRTGRAGRPGRAFTIGTPGDSKYLRAITELIGHEIPKETLEGLAVPAAKKKAEPKAKAKAKAEPETKPEANVEAKPEPVAEAKAEAPKERKPRRSTKPQRSAKPKSEPAAKPKKDGPVTGMGDHVPAFMLRSVRTAG